LQDAVFMLVSHVLSGVIALRAVLKQHGASYRGGVWMLLLPIKSLKCLTVSTEAATVIAAQHLQGDQK